MGRLHFRGIHYDLVDAGRHVDQKMTKPPAIGTKTVQVKGWTQDSMPFKSPSNPVMFLILTGLCVAFALERWRTKTKNWQRKLRSKQLERFEYYRSLQERADLREHKRQEAGRRLKRPGEGD